MCRTNSGLHKIGQSCNRGEWRRYIGYLRIYRIKNGGRHKNSVASTLYEKASEDFFRTSIDFPAKIYHTQLMRITA